MSEWQVATLTEMLDLAIEMLRGQDERFTVKASRKEYRRLPITQVNDAVRVQIEQRDCLMGYTIDTFDQAYLTNGGSPLAAVRLFDGVPFVIFAARNVFRYIGEQRIADELVRDWADQHEYKLLLTGDIGYEDIVYNVRGVPLYKVLRPDGIATRSGARWPMPGHMNGNWIPGAEVIVDDVSLCISGLHFSIHPYDIFTRWYPVIENALPTFSNTTWPVVYEAEALCEVGIGDSKGKVAVPMARLLKRAENISDRFTKSLESYFFIALKKVTREYPYGVYYRQSVKDGDIVEVEDGEPERIFRFSADTMAGHFPYGHLLVHFAKMLYRQARVEDDSVNLYPSIFVYLLNGMLHRYEKDSEEGMSIAGPALKNDLEFLRDTLHFNCDPAVAERVLDTIATGNKPLYIKDGKLYVKVEKEAVDSDQ